MSIILRPDQINALNWRGAIYLHTPMPADIARASRETINELADEWAVREVDLTNVNETVQQARITRVSLTRHPETLAPELMIEIQIVCHTQQAAMAVAGRHVRSAHYSV